MLVDVEGDAGRQLEAFRDVFGVPIADGRTNIVDLGSHYQYSPERWRLYRDGARQFPEYGSVAGFTDEADHWALSPAQDETLVLETTDRPRYVVQFELVRTLAFRLSRQLESGDLVRAGAYDGQDGWAFEKRPSHGSHEVDAITLRNGSVVRRVKGTVGRALTAVQTRLAISSPWYDIGRSLFVQSYPASGKQKNRLVARSSVDDGRGPRTGNLPTRFEVQRGASSSSLTLECGSAGATALGNATPQTRLKAFTKTIAIGTTGAWVPLFAMRVAPSQGIVNVQLRGVQAIKWDANGDVSISARSFAPENVHDSGGGQLQDADFDSPAVLGTQNSALETSDAVAEVVQSDGSTFSASMAEPGGYQIGFDRLTGGNKGISELTAVNARQQVPPQDHVVVMGYAHSATGNVTVAVPEEEDW